jgi:hypothetical protein
VSLEIVFLLNLIDEIKSLFKEMEGVYEKNWDLVEESKS